MTNTLIASASVVFYIITTIIISFSIGFFIGHRKAVDTLSKLKHK